MDDHVALLLRNGWEVMNSANDPGHVRVGKTLIVGTLTGGLSLLFGASRTATTITLTFKKAADPSSQLVGPTSVTARPPEPFVGDRSPVPSAVVSDSRPWFLYGLLGFFLVAFVLLLLAGNYAEKVELPTSTKAEPPTATNARRSAKPANTQ